MNNKLIKIIGSFLLLIPFRLPIAVLLIRLLDSIAQIEGTSLPSSLLCGNVIVTKIVYDIVFSVLFIYNMEMISRELKGRKSSDGIYWWTVILIISLIVYTIFDAISTYDLFYALH